MKSNSILFILIGLISLSCITDIVTFILKFHNVAFEANPVYLLTGSIAFVLILKLVINTVLCIVLFYNKKLPVANITRYAIVLMSIYFILAQFLGAYSNLQVSNLVEQSPPGSIVPMEKTQAINTMINISLFYIYLPFFISCIAFWLWERIYATVTNREMKR